MRNPDIDTTFSAIRQLPLEMDFERIEQFILQQPHLPVSSKISFKNWLDNNRTLLITLIIGLLVTVALFNRPVQKTASRDVSNIIAIDPIPAPLTQELPALQEPPLVKKPPVVKEKSTPLNSDTSSLPKKGAILTDVKKTGALITPPLKNLTTSQEDPNRSTQPAAISIPGEEAEYDESNRPLRVRTFTSSYCNFEGEDAWIKAFLKALISDQIIRDTLDLRFTISGKSFKVNGKQMDAGMVTRYNDLYQSVTNHRLNEKSKISLSVGGTSCTLSKTIDE